MTILSATLWLTEKFDERPLWVHNFWKSSAVFVAFSLYALVMMSFDRYLATCCPIFHQTSVTKTKLSTPFAILNIVALILFLLSFNDFVFPYEVLYLISSFMVARKSRRNNKIAPGTKKPFSLKNVSYCVLAVACFAAFFTPCVGLRLTETILE